MRPGPTRSTFDWLWPFLLLPLLSLCVVLPLLVHGPSCGHDFNFHTESWIDAADQMRHGHLFPHWAQSAAYNAGEPRFVFYPPLSWMLGAVLMLVLPAQLVPAAYTWLALTGAAASMYVLSRRFAETRASLLAASVYIANPYLLFTVFERTAYGELLAAVWMPLLFRAALAQDFSAPAIALPLALLWLSNAPAGVMGTYALVLLLLCRVAYRWKASRGGPEEETRWFAWLSPAAGGLALGLALAAFYLLPAAWERRYVQVAMAIIPNMRVEDNFLFGHSGDGPHDRVLHTASVIAVTMLILTAAALAPGWFREAKREGQTAWNKSIRGALAAMAVLISFLLTPLSLPLWRLLPELSFLQFPWRLLTLLGCVLGVGVALALRRLRLASWAAGLLALALVAGATALAFQPFRQGCDAGEPPAERLALFRSHHGAPPTDEYTPVEADNDPLRWDDPGWWLATAPNQPAPNTVPNPAAAIENYDQPPPVDQTISAQAPRHLELLVDKPEDLILNLRDYPAWQVTVNGAPATRLSREDGLMAIAVPAGKSTVEVRWQLLPDVWVGDVVSVCALALSGWLWVRSRRIRA